jgi:hypothetical protein
MNKHQVFQYSKELNPALKQQFIKGYDQAVIGITLDLQRVVYSLTKMVGRFTHGEFDNEDKLSNFFNQELPKIQEKHKDVLIIHDYIYG